MSKPPKNEEENNKIKLIFWNQEMNTVVGVIPDIRP